MSLQVSPSEVLFRGVPSDQQELRNGLGAVHENLPADGGRLVAAEVRSGTSDFVRDKNQARTTSLFLAIEYTAGKDRRGNKNPIAPLEIRKYFTSSELLVDFIRS